MKYFVEEQNMPVKSAADKVKEITGGKVTKSRAREVYRNRTSRKKPEGLYTPPADKPVKTTPDISPKQAVAAISNMDNDDKQKVATGFAKMIKTGQAPKMVGAPIAAAVGSKPRRKGGENKKPIDNFYRLNHHFKVVMDGLTIWADGAMKPTTKDEIACAQAMLLKAPNFIIQMHRLGVDIEGLFETLVREKPNEKNEQNQIQFKPG
jgi:hypothetical protein